MLFIIEYIINVMYVPSLIQYMVVTMKNKNIFNTDNTFMINLLLRGPSTMHVDIRAHTLNGRNGIISISTI